MFHSNAGEKIKIKLRILVVKMVFVCVVLKRCPDSLKTMKDLMNTGKLLKIGKRYKSRVELSLIFS